MQVQTLIETILPLVGFTANDTRAFQNAGLFHENTTDWTKDGLGFLAQFSDQSPWIDEIKKAVRNDSRVIAGSPGYVVQVGKQGSFSITFEPNQYSIGLHDQSGTALNGTAFFIEHTDGRRDYIGYGFSRDWKSGEITIHKPSVLLDCSLSKSKEIANLP